MRVAQPFVKHAAHQHIPIWGRLATTQDLDNICFSTSELFMHSCLKHVTLLVQLHTHRHLQHLIGGMTTATRQFRRSAYFATSALSACIQPVCTSAAFSSDSSAFREYCHLQKGNRQAHLARTHRSACCKMLAPTYRFCASFTQLVDTSAAFSCTLHSAHCT